MNYCKDGIIDVLVEFVEMSQSSQQFVIRFNFVFNRNKQFNEEPIIRLLNSMS